MQLLEWAGVQEVASDRRGREKGRLLTSIMERCVHLAKRFKDRVDTGIVALLRARGNCGERIGTLLSIVARSRRGGEKIVEYSQ